MRGVLLLSLFVLGFLLLQSTADLQNEEYEEVSAIETIEAKIHRVVREAKKEDNSDKKKENKQKKNKKKNKKKYNKDTELNKKEENNKDKGNEKDEGAKGNKGKKKKNKSKKKNKDTKSSVEKSNEKEENNDDKGNEKDEGVKGNKTKKKKNNKSKKKNKDTESSVEKSNEKEENNKGEAKKKNKGVKGKKKKKSKKGKKVKKNDKEKDTDKSKSKKDENSKEVEAKDKSKTKKKKKKSGKKKTKKGKRKNKKGKRNNKNGKKKKKKGKKNKKKRKKNKKKGKKNKKKGKKSGRQDGCTANPDCLANLVKYLKQMKDKVANFDTQRKRITTFVRLSTNKGNKADLFIPTLMKVIATGGSNISALRCQGDTTTKELSNLTQLITNLQSCQADIEAACLTTKPDFDQTEIDDCTTKMTAFEGEVEACLAKDQPGERCACWDAAVISESSNDIAPCNIAPLSSQIATFKNNCTKVFANCRKLEDSAADVIFTCSPKSNPTYLLQQIKGSQLNIEALGKLKTTIESVSARRKRQATTCAEFTESVTGITGMIMDKPFESTGPAKIDDLIESKPESCTATEKETLKATLTKVDETMQMADVTIKLATTRYTEITGNAPSEEDIAAVKLS